MAISKPSINDQVNDANINNSIENIKAGTKRGKSYVFIKRIIDVLGASVGLILFLPLFLIISLTYVFGSQRGPILFKQERTGLRGKTFYIYKFRSMVVDAEDKLKNDKHLYNKYINNNYKLDPDEDPRITKIGKFLRKTSLDELPQFLNVLRGEMSLVGPRPIIKQELVQYGDRKNIFLSVKPGMTGYWQASGRSDVGYPERINIELFYIYHRCITLDLKIICKTIYTVFLRRGAY